MLLYLVPCVLALGMTGEQDPPSELGRVEWRRDFDVAMAAAKTTGKPVVVLFDEVPG